MRPLVIFEPATIVHCVTCEPRYRASGLAQQEYYSPHLSIRDHDRTSSVLCPKGLIHFGLIWSAVGHRADVRRLHFGPAPSIYNADSTHCARICVCFLNPKRKSGFTEWTTDHPLNDRTVIRLLLLRKAVESFADLGGYIRYLADCPDKTRLGDQIVLGIGNRADGTAECALISLTIRAFKRIFEIMLALFKRNRRIPDNRIRRRRSSLAGSDLAQFGRPWPSQSMIGVRLGLKHHQSRVAARNK